MATAPTPLTPAAAGPAYTPIRDYALIGDCRTAALVSLGGSIDFLCLPRFDGAAVFAALLDSGRGGRFLAAPAGESRSRRRYLGRSNGLETIHETAGGVLRTVDVMSVAGEADRRRETAPEHEVLRCLECVTGEVEIEIGCDPRLPWGSGVPRLRRRGALGITWELGDQLLALRSEVPLSPDPVRPGAWGREKLAAGERRFVSLSSVTAEPAVFLPLGAAAAARLARSLTWWEDWSAGCRYAGPWAEEVLRSLLTLKLLTYAPSGAVVAAPTTSLPEEIGGSRNWDYRYCWLRDTSWTLTSFFDLGLPAEGEAFFSWLLYATRVRSAPHLRILNVLYDVYGRTRKGEREVPWLEGYAGSRPVRLGNGAARQLQLDVFGEVVLAAYEYVERGGILDPLEGRLLRQLGDTVRRLWREPDEGIWEKRSGRFHHTYSKAMCWVALDRLLGLAGRGLVRLPVAGYERDRAALRQVIETEGWNERLGSYVDVLGGDDVDASLLLLGLRGYDDPARSPRLLSTLAVVRRRLERDGLLYRYPAGSDGLPGGEAAFGICSFWLTEFLARAGRLDEAKSSFGHALGYANDLGLFAEEIDPRSGAALGNFPQAFTHVGLITAALAIAAAMGQAPPAKFEAPARGVKGVRM
jgi:GH15 family glucan-1,4-alpha-glucosidase